MRHSLSLHLVVLISVLVVLIEEVRGACDGAANCKECLETGGTCKWCADEHFDNVDVRRPRCNDLATLTQQNCKNIQIEDGSVSQNNTVFNDAVQLSPKKVKLTLRPGQSKSFQLSVKPAPNYPVRLYYLMDLSYSMKDDLENLKKLGREIAKEIQKITSNFQLAFGAFVDKSIPPYSWLTQERACDTCAPPIGFHHVFDFNRDPKMFEDAVTDQIISGNLDPPEGGFDALMQVAVCGDKIWPKEDYSRKIVIFVTDAAFHIAGDGKLGGITVPNDGQCHLKDLTLNQEKVKYYTESTTMDYPSVSFLKQRMKDNDIIPIIAATKEMRRVYEELAEAWKDLGTGFGELSGDSSNIVNLVRDNYQRISSTIRVVSKEAPGVLDIKHQVTSGCDGENLSADRKQCSNVRINQQVDFSVSVTAKQCPDNYKNGDNFKVNVPGFGNVEVEVSYICDCACDLEVGIPNAPKCNTTGTFKCGICDCDAGRFGKFCQCDEDVQEDDTLCMRPNSTDTEPCSGNGECVCGKCVCKKQADPKKVISGTYCQCNNYNCDRHNGKICGGTQQGICKCGKCECTGSYYGENCGKKNCTIANLECLDGNNVECSNHGSCDCGICQCDPGYEGKHCEKCVRCDDRCRLEAPCALCHAPYNVGDKDVCDQCKIDRTVVLVNTTRGDRQTDIRCKTELPPDCYVSFNVDTLTDVIYLKNEAECTRREAAAPPILPIVLGIIGGIVLIGLILLLAWKLMDTMFHRREVKALEESSRGAKKSEQNPLYIQPQQTINNPTYVG